MSNPVPPIPYKIPVADAGGYLSQAWSAWFRELYTRIGGSSASTNSQLLALIENLQDDVTALEAQTAALNQGRQL